jgi:ABC-2 type transport system permease protein
MNAGRVVRILRKDLRLGPRSPIFLYAVILPLVMTFVVQVAFTRLLEPAPRLGIVDRGASQVTDRARQLDGIEVDVVTEEAELRRQVEAGDLDAGLVLTQSFDDDLRAGRRPPLVFYIGGESLASDRVILSVAALDLVRAVEGRQAPVEVVVEGFGVEELPMSDRLIPVILMFALIMSGVFLTAFGVVEEREKRTLDALIVTPVRLSEVLLAKALLGFLVALVMSAVTLALNGALDAPPLGLLLTLMVAALMSVSIGLVFATAARNGQMLFALIKGTGFLIAGPVVFYLFPDWPQWIARVFPTYWFIDPLFQTVVLGASLGQVWWELAVALAITAAFGAVVVLMTRRMQAQMGGGS